MGLKIKSVGELKTASDNRQYYAVEFSAGFGQKNISRNIFETFKTDSKTGLPTQEKVWSRGTREEALAQMRLGHEVEAQKVTKTVEPYMIGENTVNSYSTVVFADEKIESVFASANHPILNEETGELIGAKKKALLGTAPKAAIDEKVEA